MEASTDNALDPSAPAPKNKRNKVPPADPPAKTEAPKPFDLQLDAVNAVVEDIHPGNFTRRPSDDAEVCEVTVKVTVDLGNDHSPLPYAKAVDVYRKEQAEVGSKAKTTTTSTRDYGGVEITVDDAVMKNKVAFRAAIKGGIKTTITGERKVETELKLVGYVDADLVLPLLKTKGREVKLSTNPAQLEMFD